MFDYPHTPTSDHVDQLHGETIRDPYRWLEEIDSDQTRDWIPAQNELTFSYLQGLEARGPIRLRLTELWDFERSGVPIRRGDRYFFTRNDGLQNQAVLYWLADLDAEPQVLLDPNMLSDDGTIALSGWSVSRDGCLLAYGLSSGGSDWQEWHVREVETGADREDHLQWVKFSGASWDHTNEGFYYSRYDAPQEGQALKDANYFQKLCYHRLGTDQSADAVIYESPDHKEWGFHGEVSEDGRCDTPSRAL